MYCGNKTFDNVKVKFNCLPNGLPGKMMFLRGIGKAMVLPSSGFNPVVGESYYCFLVMANAQYIEGSKSFPVAHATAYNDNEASPSEVFFHTWENRHNKVATSLADSGASLANIRNRLPDQEKVLRLIATRDRREKVIFHPRYLDSDPVVSGRPSMRFYNLENDLGLVPTREYRVEELSVKATGKKNVRGAEIVEVTVRIL